MQLVFDNLPVVEARITAGRVCHDWASAAQQHKQQHPQNPSAAPLLPLWYFNELWDQDLPHSTRNALVKAALVRGQVAALQHLMCSTASGILATCRSATSWQSMGT